MNLDAKKAELARAKQASFAPCIAVATILVICLHARMAACLVSEHDSSIALHMPVPCMICIPACRGLSLIRLYEHACRHTSSRFYL